MNRCIILGAAPMEDYSLIPSGQQIVICADGGFVHAKAMGLHVDILVGDFDSLDQTVEAVADEIYSFPKQKDDTDLMLAVKCGIEHGCDDFTLYGVTGGRFDHTLGAITVLAYLSEAGYGGRIIDEQHEIRVLSEGLHTIERPLDRYVSLFVLESPQALVKLKGFAYPGDITLSSTRPLGVSNEIIEKIGEIEVISGPILMIISKNSNTNKYPCV